MVVKLNWRLNQKWSDKWSEKWREKWSDKWSENKVHTTNLIYNVNYKGEVGTRFLGFREKNNFYFPMSDKGFEKCH